jgi:formiminotetrahydrofolate cyclodeaminase
MRNGRAVGNVGLASGRRFAETLVPMIDRSFRVLVDELAAKTPTPGGGAAAAMTACMGAALVQMVLRFSRGRKGNEAREAALASAEELLQGHLQRLLPTAERDCRSFDLVSAAYKMPKETDAQQAIRQRAIEEAMVGAMVVPEELLCMVRDVFRAVSGVIDAVPKNIISDLASGAALLGAAADGALLNVRINAAYLKNRDLAGKAVDRVRGVRQEIQAQQSAIAAAVEKLLA